MKSYAISSLLLLSFVCTTSYANHHLGKHHPAKDVPITVKIHDVEIGKARHPDKVVDELKIGARVAGIDVDIKEISNAGDSIGYQMQFDGRGGAVEHFCESMSDSDNDEVADIGNKLCDDLQAKWDKNK